jgi:N6-L-threonylcarbamoyladenine synthase
MHAAATATRQDRRLPRAWMKDSGDFSFSGLKTAVRRMVTDELAAMGSAADGDEPDGGRLPVDSVAEIAWAFQESVVDVLATKTLHAATATGARTIVVGGGVAANRVLRDRIAAGADELGVPLMVPRPALCTDNGAMIGAAGYQRFLAGTRADHGLEARPSWKLAQPLT